MPLNGSIMKDGSRSAWHRQPGAATQPPCISTWSRWPAYPKPLGESRPIGIELRVAELGAGLMLTQAQVSAATLRATAARLLAEPNFAAAATRIGDSFHAAGGMPRAADEVETLLRTRTGVEAH